MNTTTRSMIPLPLQVATADKKALRVCDGARDGLKDRIHVQTDSCRAADDHHSDERRHQRVLDGRYTIFLSKKLPHQDSKSLHLRTPLVAYS